MPDGLTGCVRLISMAAVAVSYCCCRWLSVCCSCLSLVSGPCSRNSTRVSLLAALSLRIAAGWCCCCPSVVRSISRYRDCNSSSITSQHTHSSPSTCLPSTLRPLAELPPSSSSDLPSPTLHPSARISVPCRQSRARAATSDQLSRATRCSLEICRSSARITCIGLHYACHISLSTFALAHPIDV